MTPWYWVASGIAACLSVYLILGLLRPEWFE